VEIGGHLRLFTFFVKNTLSLEIELLLKGRKDGVQKKIGRIILKIYGFAQFLIIIFLSRRSKGGGTTFGGRGPIYWGGGGFGGFGGGSGGGGGFGGFGGGGFGGGGAGGSW